MGYHYDNLTQELYDAAGAKAEPRADEWRRSSARRTSPIPLEVDLDGKILVAIIVNVGPDSLCVKVREDIRVGSRVRVRKACEEGVLWHGAEVLHCTETIAGFKLGLKVEKGIRMV